MKMRLISTTARLITCIVVFLVLAVNVFCADGSKKIPEKRDIPDWQARWELARTLSYAKKLDESIEQYKKLLSEKPDLEQARSEMATVMFWKGRQAEALKILKKIPTESMTPEAKMTAADIYASNGNYNTAEALYREYLNANPRDDEVRFRMAEMLSWAGKYRESVKEYEIILSSRPKDKQVRRRYALVLSWMGNHEKAAEELKKTLEENNNQLSE